MTPQHGVTEFLRTFSGETQIFFDAELDLLIVLDANGNVKRVNPAFERVLGRDESEVLGVPIVGLVHLVDMAKFMHSFSLIKSVYPFRLLKKSSGAVLVELIAFKFKRMDNDTGRRGFLILRPIRDVDE